MLENLRAALAVTGLYFGALGALFGTAWLLFGVSPPPAWLWALGATAMTVWGYRTARALPAGSDPE